MKVRAIAVAALAALTVGTLIGPSGIATAKGKKKSGPVVVGTDPSGDWAQEGDTTVAPLGDLLGQDLTEARIEMADKKTVNFIIQLNSLPPTGGIPEISRYVWDMNVDGEFTELDGKFTNYTRGACDPTSGQCPPPRDPGLQPFMVRGNCTTDGTANVTTCEEIGIVQAVFDAGQATITIPVPLELINAKPGSKIEPGANIFGGSVSASHAAFVSSTAGPLDSLTITETFVVPSKKKK